ncbi:hypothetical protein LEN26_007286 [Aphanomyces euteiches]|nr:hypothetical protein AeMF1_001713 [Aphanomyces euteiches]KAH9132780.1 hypothetical protein LEN26_007286 [Aphanomyces euteiches]KAH9190957.1 hypothetical protein AeNC1_007071 [Aphanomyces euteiches]
MAALDLGDAEKLWIEWMLRITSLLSAIGCVYILARFFRRTSRSKDISFVLVTALAGFELVIAIAKFPALSFLNFDKVEGGYKLVQEGVGTMCYVQAFLLDVFMFQALLWNACMAYNLLRWVVYRDGDDKLRARFWVYFFASSLFSVLWGLSAALPIWPSSINKGGRVNLFGYAKFTCWMQGSKYFMYRYFPFLVLTLVFIVAVMIKIHRVIRSRAKLGVSMLPSTSNDLVTKIQHRLVLYTMGFIVLYTPITVYRMIAAVSVETAANLTALAVISQALLNLQGFFNAVIYGGFLQSSRNRSDSTLSDNLPPPSVVLEETRSGIPSTVRGVVGNDVSIFASTFNMAEGAVPSEDEFEKWIPRGHDVYVIGLQECLNLQPMRQTMVSHLKKINGKVFVEYGREIGRKETKLGYHGFIAITVYVASEEVQAGHFQMHLEAISKVNRGTNLIGLGRASNKGAVGFSFSYYNTTFAVVNCHLASDTSGKSKIKKRHRDGINILTSMHLQSIDNEFDCHLMAHHTIFMGDLNYRLTAKCASPKTVVQMIASILNTTHKQSAMKRGQVYSYNQILAKDALKSEADTYNVDAEDVYVIANTPSALTKPNDCADEHATTPLRRSELMESPFSNTSSVEVTWKTLMDHDELRRSMEDGVIFHDFDEARISFPPTYRRVLGKMLDTSAVNQWTPALVSELYTTVLGDSKVRVPSYTDRILFHSLPGLRGQMNCVQYTSAEFIGTSDHKPVSCVFEASVDKKTSSLMYMASARESPQSKAKTLDHFTVYLSKLSVQWGAALESFSIGEDDESDENVSKPSNASLSTESRSSIPSGMTIEGMQVRSVFPLPCEDVFAEERKLTEVADQLLLNATHGGDAKYRLKPTWKVSPWSLLSNQGLKQSAALQSRKLMHVALNFMLPWGASAGQCVIDLAEAKRRFGSHFDFSVALTIGGRRTGTLSGSVCMALFGDKT